MKHISLRTVISPSFPLTVEGFLVRRATSGTYREPVHQPRRMTCEPRPDAHVGIQDHSGHHLELRAQSAHSTRQMSYRGFQSTITARRIWRCRSCPRKVLPKLLEVALPAPVSLAPHQCTRSPSPNTRDDVKECLHSRCPPHNDHNTNSTSKAHTDSPRESIHSIELSASHSQRLKCSPLHLPRHLETLKKEEDRQTDRQIRQTDQTDRQTDRQTDSQSVSQSVRSDRQTDRQKDRQREQQQLMTRMRARLNGPDLLVFGLIIEPSSGNRFHHTLYQPAHETTPDSSREAFATQIRLLFHDVSRSTINSSTFAFTTATVFASTSIAFSTSTTTSFISTSSAKLDVHFLEDVVLGIAIFDAKDVSR